MEYLVKPFAFLVGVAATVAVLTFVSLPLIALQAYVTCDLWGLFMTPWLNIQAPSLWGMAGVILVVQTMATGIQTASKEDTKDAKDKSWTEVFTPIVNAFLGVLLFWGIGHLFFWLGH